MTSPSTQASRRRIRLRARPTRAATDGDAGACWGRGTRSERQPVGCAHTTPAMAAICERRGACARDAGLRGRAGPGGVARWRPPAQAAKAIRAACRVETFDVPALYREAALAGSPAIPLARMLTERVGRRRAATSTGAPPARMSLTQRWSSRCARGLICCASACWPWVELCAALAERHRATPMAGRTLLQQALPITFGLKAARWLALTTRQASGWRRFGRASPLCSLAGLLGRWPRSAPLARA